MYELTHRILLINQHKGRFSHLERGAVYVLDYMLQRLEGLANIVVTLAVCGCGAQALEYNRGSGLFIVGEILEIGIYVVRGGALFWFEKTWQRIWGRASLKVIA